MSALLYRICFIFSDTWKDVLSRIESDAVGKGVCSGLLCLFCSMQLWMKLNEWRLEKSNHLVFSNPIWNWQHLLTHVRPMFPFYSPWRHQWTKGGVERTNIPGIGLNCFLFVCMKNSWLTWRLCFCPTCFFIGIYTTNTWNYVLFSLFMLPRSLLVSSLSAILGFKSRNFIAHTRFHNDELHMGKFYTVCFFPDHKVVWPRC